MVLKCRIRLLDRHRGRGRMIQLVVCLIVGRVGKDLLIRIFLRHQILPIIRRDNGLI